ncbi:unnamed protein product [Closterium sp. NIES-53]
MYAVSTSDEGDCYLCLPPDPRGEAAALGACEAAALGASAFGAPSAGESALSGTASAQVFHTFTLDSGASRSFFRDRTTLTPLSRPVAVSLADPLGVLSLLASSAPQGPPSSGVSQVDGVEPVKVAFDFGAARGAEPVGAGSGGAESRGAEPGGAESGGTEPGGAEPGGAGSAREASRGTSSRRELLSPQEVREWFARRWSRAAGAGGPPVTTVGPAGASGAAGAGAAVGVGTGVGPAGGTAGAAGGTGAAGAAGVGAVGAGGASGTGAATGDPGAVPVGSRGRARPRPYFVPLLEQAVSPLPSPSPYTGPTGGLAERREPASRPVSPVRTTRTSRRAPCPRPPAVPGTHQMTLQSDSLRAASPTVARLLSTVVTDPSFESTAASALVAELDDFAARCRLDYATRLVAESDSVCPPSVGGECALSTDVLEDRQEEVQCFAAALPHLVSTLIAPEGDPDAPDIPTPRLYAEAIEGRYSS